MAFLRRNSFENKLPQLLNINLSTRYCERKFKEYLADDENDCKFISTLNLIIMRETLYGCWYDSTPS